jgi:beta-lactamase superfamily II metal-dependent hydrolase
MRIPPHLAFATALLLASLAACDGSPVAPEPAPVITVSGVEDGSAYDSPVTIAIAVDRGSWEAQLNGAPFTSGTTVQETGSYTLIVTARSGVTTVTKQIAFTLLAPPGGTLIIRLFDLGPNEMGGGGDAILVTDSSAAGRVHALIDAGPAGVDGSDPGYVARQLAALGVDSLAFLLLTHGHSDHYAGMPAVISATRIGTFIYNGQVRSLSSYNALVTQARNAATRTEIPGDTLAVRFGRSQAASDFTIIPPLATFLNVNTSDGSMLNEGSVGASLRRGAFRMFFTGDGEYEANRRWRTQFGGYTANLTVLKVGHHGANNAIFDSGTTGPSTWLDHTAPAVAVISANGITHPRVRALTRLLEGTNRQTYCTSVHGRIEIRVFSDARYQVSVERNSGSDCVPGSTATT